MYYSYTEISWLRSLRSQKIALSMRQVILSGETGSEEDSSHRAYLALKPPYPAYKSTLASRLPCTSHRDLRKTSTQNHKNHGLLQSCHDNLINHGPLSANVSQHRTATGPSFASPNSSGGVKSPAQTAFGQGAHLETWILIPLS